LKAGFYVAGRSRNFDSRSRPFRKMLWLIREITDVNATLQGYFLALNQGARPPFFDANREVSGVISIMAARLRLTER
jgi:hypothetical protein